MAGWIINKLSEFGGREVIRIDGDGGEELWGLFGSPVSLQEVVDLVVQSAEAADWIVAEGEPLLVVDRHDEP